MKIEIVPVWKALTPELSAELVAFWNDQNAIRNAAEAGRRSEQVVCIARDAEGALCGVATAIVKVLPRLRQPMYYYRQEIENATIAAAYRRAHEPGFEATFIGYSPRGLQLRVSYFDAAVLLPPAPLRVPALAARGRRPDPATTHTQPRRGNARS